MDKPNTNTEPSGWTLSAVNEELYQKSEKLNDFQRKCEARLSHEDSFDFQAKLRMLRKIYSLSVVNNRNIGWYKKATDEFSSKNVPTNMYAIVSFVILSCVLIFSGASATLSTCFMLGLMLYWFLVVSDNHNTEQKNLIKSTAYEIQQMNLEKQAEEFNVNSTLFPLRNVLEVSAKIDVEEDPIVKEELDLKGQILFSRMIIGLLTRYSAIKEMESSEFYEPLKDTNNEMLKKFTNRLPQN
ncbi:hypothetical protein [Polynucleobacter sp. UB-Raua-W9]|jgi:flagellar basal body-associated protein FliL|uniref:hypothetical protein n=1 Tax=Polynucleobacter sp. UB-Raua-W9 TaxID=1819736 RepID=UPI001BFE2729|nr:hypothetical protein [Polynucleobacter sp. UB-Raua-W9]QWD71582.1 hypothetical protein AOC07_04775 [Polynucleobacter sp. UB-Raua-W9]